MNKYQAKERARARDRCEPIQILIKLLFIIRFSYSALCRRRRCHRRCCLWSMTEQQQRFVLKHVEIELEKYGHDYERLINKEINYISSFWFRRFETAVWHTFIRADTDCHSRSTHDTTIGWRDRAAAVSFAIRCMAARNKPKKE